MPRTEPSYRALRRTGELKARVALAHARLADCDLCARFCHVDRLRGIAGAVCRTGERARVHSHGPHFGEEDPLRGTRGSGTIFFSWCNLRCDFCQNWTISQKGEGEEVEPEVLAALMLELQEKGCHNINLVTPSHVVAQILAALEIAAGRGLALPLVYNTGGYDSLPALELLDGVVDIYMPDMKYGDSGTARQYSHAKDYREVNQAAVKEMHRQVGDLTLNSKGVAERGLLIRHLVMPGGVASSERVLKFIAEEISVHSYVNIMDQYRPEYRAEEHRQIDRRTSNKEYLEAIQIAKRLRLYRGF
jgi:putative pyruvate formate lyase activating enzyme